MDKKQLENLRWEFKIIISRCRCSRASLRITVEQAREMNSEGLGIVYPLEPSCTPSKCFPTLYKLLYPKGGFTIKSDLLRRSKK